MRLVSKRKLKIEAKYARGQIEFQQSNMKFSLTNLYIAPFRGREGMLEAGCDVI